MEHLQGEEDIDKKIEEIHAKLEEDKEGLEDLHKTLFMKEREANQELNEARAELIGVSQCLPYSISLLCPTFDFLPNFRVLENC